MKTYKMILELTIDEAQNESPRVWVQQAVADCLSRDERVVVITMEEVGEQ